MQTGAPSRSVGAEGALSAPSGPCYAASGRPLRANPCNVAAAGRGAELSGVTADFSPRPSTQVHTSIGLTANSNRAPEHTPANNAVQRRQPQPDRQARVRQANRVRDRPLVPQGCLSPDEADRHARVWICPPASARSVSGIERHEPPRGGSHLKFSFLVRLFSFSFSFFLSFSRDEGLRHRRDRRLSMLLTGIFQMDTRSTHRTAQLCSWLHVYVRYITSAFQAPVKRDNGGAGGGGHPCHQAKCSALAVRACEPPLPTSRRAPAVDIYAACLCAAGGIKARPSSAGLGGGRRRKADCGFRSRPAPRTGRPGLTGRRLGRRRPCMWAMCVCSADTAALPSAECARPLQHYMHGYVRTRHTRGGRVGLGGDGEAWFCGGGCAARLIALVSFYVVFVYVSVHSFIYSFIRLSFIRLLFIRLLLVYSFIVRSRIYLLISIKYLSLIAYCSVLIVYYVPTYIPTHLLFTPCCTRFACSKGARQPVRVW